MPIQINIVANVFFSLSRVILIISFLLALNACASTQKQYDQDSWKTMIPDSCESFFDGCNNCQRSPGSEVAACTRMACEIYTKPFCRDKANGPSIIKR